MYNNTPYIVSGQTPLYLLAGYNSNLIIEIADDPIEGEIPDVTARIVHIKVERDTLKAY